MSPLTAFNLAKPQRKAQKGRGRTEKCSSTLLHGATTRSDRVEGILTSTLNLWKWIMALETAGDDGDLGQSHNDPS